MKRHIERQIAALDWFKENHEKIGEQNLDLTLYYAFGVAKVKTKLGYWLWRKKYPTRIDVLYHYWPISN